MSAGRVFERGSKVGANRVGSVPAALARVGGLWVLGVGAPELQHETVDDAVEVKAVVEAELDQIHKVGHCDRHSVHVELSHEGALTVPPIDGAVGGKGTGEGRRNVEADPCA